MPDEIDFTSDEYYMTLALKEAAKAYVADEVPIGAIIVQNEQVIGRASNQVETLKDATAHAEIIAITQASAKIEGWRLTDSTLYVTKEPCPMCAGAAVNSRIGRIVFGVSDPKGGGAGGAFSITSHKELSHEVEVCGGLLRDECLALLQSFFQEKRKKKDS